MGRSNRLRLRDVEGVLHLVGECRELWVDPPAWRQHLVAGACRLTGQAVGHYIEVLPPTPRRPFAVLGDADCGWRDATARAHYQGVLPQFWAIFNIMPGAAALFDQLSRSDHAAGLRAELCPDDTLWYGSVMLNEFRRPAYNNGYAVSAVLDRQTGVINLLNVNQDTADPPPCVRERRILTFLHRRVAPLIGTELATEHHRGLVGLSPQLRVTLERLLTGDSEKEIAHFLGLRPATVHEYVGRIYRHFGVDSRATLMTYFLRRKPALRERKL